MPRLPPQRLGDSHPCLATTARVCTLFLFFRSEPSGPFHASCLFLISSDECCLDRRHRHTVHAMQTNELDTVCQAGEATERDGEAAGDYDCGPLPPLLLPSSRARVLQSFRALILQTFRALIVQTFRALICKLSGPLRATCGGHDFANFRGPDFANFPAPDFANFPGPDFANFRGPDLQTFRPLTCNARGP